MKFSKNIYLDDTLIIDTELKAASQNDLRERLRTGHVVHDILGELAISLHDFVRVPEKQRLAALMDLLKHHERMQCRINPKASKSVKKTPEPDTPVKTEETPGTTATAPKRKHNFSMPGA